jgi:predicted nucleic acid-binding protein
MAGSVLVDAGFLVALLNKRDGNHGWAKVIGSSHPPPWKSCDAVLSEAFHLLGKLGSEALDAMLRRRAIISAFHLGEGAEAVLALMRRYADLPMSFADACLVRMTETYPEPLILTTDADFRIYRRHGRQVVPCVLPD